MTTTYDDRVILVFHPLHCKRFLKSKEAREGGRNHKGTKARKMKKRMIWILKRGNVVVRIILC